jgi:hypothetical protein
MKSLLLSLLILPSISWAQGFKANINNFNFNYTSPLGEGMARNFSFESYSEKQEARVWVEKTYEGFLVRASGATDGEFRIKNAPDFIMNAERMSLREFNFSFNQIMTIKLDEANFTSAESQLHLQNLAWSCNRDLSKSEILDQVLNGCIRRMSLKTSRLNSNSFVAEAFAAAMEIHSEALAGAGLSDLDLSIEKGSFDLSAHVKAQVSGKVRGKGEVNYNSSTKEVRIKISSVKFGFFNITGKVFSELKKNESEKMKVNQPYIIFKLN